MCVRRDAGQNVKMISLLSFRIIELISILHIFIKRNVPRQSQFMQTIRKNTMGRSSVFTHYSFISYIFFVLCTLLPSTAAHTGPVTGKSTFLIVQLSDLTPLKNKTPENSTAVKSLYELSEISAVAYANQHRYGYKRVYLERSVLGPEQYHPGWMKVYTLYHMMNMANSIERFDYLVPLDLDVIFRHMDAPLHAKMIEWGGENASIMMPEDPAANNANYWPQPRTEDSVLSLNTGFQIWKNNEETKAIVKQWLDSKDTYCAKWRNTMWKDQTCFAAEIRPHVLPKGRDDFLKIIPCNEGNGFPGGGQFPNDWGYGDQGNDGCHGEFLSHFWCESKNRPEIRVKIANLIQKAMFDGAEANVVRHQMFSFDEF